MSSPIRPTVVFARLVQKKTGLLPTQINPDFNYSDWVYATQPESQTAESVANFLRDEGYGEGDLSLARLALSDATATL